MAPPKQNSKVLEVDPLYTEIRASVGSMLDITSRIDERLKILFEKDEEYREQLQEMARQINSILQRLATMDAVLAPACEDIMDFKNRMRDIEIKLSSVDVTMSSHSSKLDKYIDWAFKIALTGVGVYATYMIGR